MAVDTDMDSSQLEVHLRDWLARASGFFVDSTVRFASDLRAAPLGAPSRRMALPSGAWVLLERDRLPFVLAGMERRRLEGRDCFVVFEFCVTGASRVSFWERAGPGEWDFLRDASSYGLG
jgi:hypothetical protein